MTQIIKDQIVKKCVNCIVYLEEPLSSTPEDCYDCPSIELTCAVTGCFNKSTTNKTRGHCSISLCNTHKHV